MALQDDVATDLMVIEADLGFPTFTWNSEDYICMPGNASKGAQLTDGGFNPIADLVIVVRKNLFTDGNFPAEQDKLTYNGATYRIDRISQDPLGVILRLFLVSPTRGLAGR